MVVHCNAEWNVIQIKHNSGSVIKTTPTTAIRSCIDPCFVPYKTTVTPSLSFLTPYLFVSLGSTEWVRTLGFEWGVLLSFENSYNSDYTVTISYGAGTGVGQYTTIPANPAGVGGNGLTTFFMQPGWYMRFTFIDGLDQGAPQSPFTIRNVSDSNVTLAVIQVEIIQPV